MKRWMLGITCGLGAMMGFLAVVAVGVSNSKSRTDMPVAEILDNLAEAATEMKGKKAAPNVIISGATVEHGARLTYMYRIPRLANNGGIDEDIAQEKAMEMTRKVCRERMMRRAIDGGAEIVYSYRNQTGRVIYEVEIDKSDCAKKS